MGRAGLYFLPKNKKMNADGYLQVLQEQMLNSSTFMNVNCLCMIMNTATRQKRLKSFFEEHQIDLF